MVLLNSNSVLIPSVKEMHRIDFYFNSDSIPVDRNPYLVYIKQQVEVAQIEKRLESSQMLPDISVGYFNQTIIGTQDVDGIPQNFGQDDRFTGVQAGITVPLWFFPFTSRTKAAKISENIARTNAENYTKSISGNYQSLLDEYNKYASSVDYYENQAVPEADLIIEQATRSYEAGALDYIDYVLTLNRALVIRQNHLETLNSYNQTVIAIEYITGKIF